MTFPAVCNVANKFEWMPAGKHGGTLPGSRGLVLHVNDGNGDPYNWWMNPAAPTASSHFQVMKDGTIIQYVRCDTVAYAQVYGNYSWHSVETEGMAEEPFNEAQLNSLARLYAWGHANCGWALAQTDDVNGSGFGVHYMGGAAWGGHTCPDRTPGGGPRSRQRAEILKRAGGNIPPVSGNRYAGEETISLGADDRFLPIGVHPVKDWQSGINSASGRGLTVDGVFGPVSDKAARDFQTIMRLKVDGVVGPVTWAALDLCLDHEGR